MAQQSGAGGYFSIGDSQYGGGVRSEGRQPGSRRAKLKGYLRAANELRQAYMSNNTPGWDNRDSRSEGLSDGLPGAYPDTAVIHGEHEQMILFPSYARKHIKRRPRSTPASPVLSPGEKYSPTSGEQDYWKQKWEEYEEDNAVVDVDVRGWIFSPFKGPMSRKQRFYFSLARQLAGLPSANVRTPSGSSPNSRATSPRPSHRERLGERLEENASKHEEEAVTKEAQRIERKGDAEAEIARRGGYSEAPSSDEGNFTDQNRTKSSDRLKYQGRAPHLRQLAAKNSSSQSDDERSITPMQKRSSWPQPAAMNSSQVSQANAHLHARLLPFFSTPSANAPISAFFYNEKESRQRTIYTNGSGHFALRAALDFVPTHVRILASEKLSATEEVTTTDPLGLSVISDIDDTIKHTSMTSGAREAFRNAFIRDLGDLTIQGVKEWYGHMAELGVKFHYVSNSPWQLYPVLTKYMSLAGLPPGSIHLKLYSGMLQGIFEPVAERKRSTMDRLARDFPDRKFILIGDSGEADLEVYTDFVIENPSRVLAVYIRDVTTPVSTGYFDSSMGPMNGAARGGPRRSGLNGSRSTASSRLSSTSDSDEDPELKAAIAASLRDMELEDRRRQPGLPPRRPTDPAAPQSHQVQSSIGDLIEFSDDDPTSPTLRPRLPRSLTDPALSPTLTPLTEVNEPFHASRARQKSIPPLPPKKPVSLRGSQSSLRSPVSHERQPSPAPSTSSTEKKQPPPKPRRPSASVKTNPVHQPRTPSPLATMRAAQIEDPLPPKARPDPPSRPPTYASLAKQKISSTYNRTPAPPPVWANANTDGPGEYVRAMSSYRKNSTQEQPPRRSRADEDDTQQPPQNKPRPPPPPPRRTLTSYPAAAAQYASNRVSNAWYGNGNGQQEAGSPGQMSPGISRKEEMWRRRWARAEFILRDRGVVLKSWRTGDDVGDDCVKLVQKTLRDMQANEK
jgi:phosphatidate phosphatase APP1